MRPIDAAGVALLLMVGPVSSTAAQDTAAVVLDFGRGTRDSVATPTLLPDSLLDLAITIFNDPATSRITGSTRISSSITGTVGVYDGQVLIRGVITGDVVVINGDLRLVEGGRVEGDIIVVGGQFFLDPGAEHDGRLLSHRGRAPVRRLPDGTLTKLGRLSSLRDLTGAATFQAGPLRLSPGIDLGTYNRVEGLPISVGASATWTPGPDLEVKARGDVIGRTTSDQLDIRGDFGWRASLDLRSSRAPTLSVGVSIGNEVVPVSATPLSPTEASISALLLRRDLRDWYGREGGSLHATWSPVHPVSISARLGFHRDRSVQVGETFSILRADEPWRSNPLIDDGRYTTLDLGASFDTRGDEQRTGGWLLAGGITITSSSELNPVVMPEQIRRPLAADSYRSLAAWFDFRRSLRLDQTWSVATRLSGSGWLDGDPLLLQRRLALGGTEPLPGFAFREVNCDIRRRPDAALPALCDRTLFAQGELRRTMAIGLGSRIGNFALGVDQLDLVLFGNIGSAWLAGSGPGQVPADKIQAISEWRADLGIGIDGGLIGAYIARAVTDDEPFRLAVRLNRRF